ncbi:hypothetical protein SVAN01_01719 [Stagonosporopsis vannaccii]|nr:hypothetical protein SVAN01_01719 [Stagonosporopsis vannaccii]
MSSSLKPGLLPPFSAAAAHAAVEASIDSSPTDYIINVLLEISGYLVSLDGQTRLFGRSVNDPYSPSLRTLYSRLHNGYLNPSPIQSHANQHLRVKTNLGQRTTKDAEHRPLEDFEDLYYAILARMQDIHQTLNARLGSGFSTLSDPIYPSGPSIANLYVGIAEYWDALNQPDFVKPLDCAVRHSRVRYLHQEIIAKVHDKEITGEDAKELLNELYDPDEYDAIQGLAWVNGWAPSMVAAWLEEKYRIVLQVEKENAEGDGLMDQKRVNFEEKVWQPQKEVRIKTEGRKAINEVQSAGVPVKLIRALHQQPQEHHVRHYESQHSELQSQLNYELEWQIKAQRVSEYTRYLRSIASNGARYLVESSNNDSNMRRNGIGGPVQRTVGEIWE